LDSLKAKISGKIQLSVTQTILGFHEKPVTNYPAFDSESKSRFCSLIAMECSVIKEAYMGLGTQGKARKEFEKLKNKCHLVKGCFCLLWHNSYLQNNNLKHAYLGVLNAN